MKKQFILLFIVLEGYSYSQQAPTPAPPTDPTIAVSSPLKGSYAWYRGGNTPLFNPASTANILGTLWNSELYIYTNSKKTAAFTVADYLSSISNGGLT
ncbi:MAG: hypothetical protein EP305_05475, partial [Bacteroidetes bacterium]